MHACWGGQEEEEPAVTHENYPHFGGHACGRDSSALLTRGLRSCPAARCQQRGQHYHAPAAGDPRTAVRRHARRHHFLLVSHCAHTMGCPLGLVSCPPLPITPSTPGPSMMHAYNLSATCALPFKAACGATRQSATVEPSVQ
jgi:hypothetical protein